jgi:hypothetical protein
VAGFSDQVDRGKATSPSAARRAALRVCQTPALLSAPISIPPGLCPYRNRCPLELEPLSSQRRPLYLASLPQICLTLPQRVALGPLIRPRHSLYMQPLPFPKWQLPHFSLPPLPQLPQFHFPALAGAAPAAGAAAMATNAAPAKLEVDFSGHWHKVW